MTDEQKAARIRALQACEKILSAYLTDHLSDDVNEDVIEALEMIDPEVDDICNQILQLEVASS